MKMRLRLGQTLLSGTLPSVQPLGLRHPLELIQGVAVHVPVDSTEQDCLLGVPFVVALDLDALIERGGPVAW
jgi:hypothetical protein